MRIHPAVPLVLILLGGMTFVPSKALAQVAPQLVPNPDYEGRPRGFSAGNDRVPRYTITIPITLNAARTALVVPDVDKVTRRTRVIWEDNTGLPDGTVVIHFEKPWMFGPLSARGTNGIRSNAAGGPAANVGISTPAIGHKYDVTLFDSQGNLFVIDGVEIKTLDPEIDCC